MEKKIFIPLFIFIFLGPCLVQSQTVGFVFHKVYIPLGTSFNGEVLINNTENITNNITINITGYEFAKLKGIESYVSGNYLISTDGRSAVVMVEPKKIQTLIVNIKAPNPGSFNLHLNARDDLGMISKDDMQIIVQFPVSFSGLTNIWILLLILLSVLIFKYVSVQTRTWY